MVSRYPGNLNISFPKVDIDQLLLEIKDLSISKGSACLDKSYVLDALNIKDEHALASIRIGIGRYTTCKEIDYAINIISKSVIKLRENQN